MKPSHLKILKVIETLDGKEADKEHFVEATGLGQRKVRDALNCLAKEGKCVIGMRVRRGQERLVVNPTANPDDGEIVGRFVPSIPYEVVPKIDQLVKAGITYSAISRAWRGVGFQIKHRTIADAANRKGAYKNVPRSAV